MNVAWAESLIVYNIMCTIELTLIYFKTNVSTQLTGL